MAARPVGPARDHITCLTFSQRFTYESSLDEDEVKTMQRRRDEQQYRKNLHVFTVPSRVLRHS